MVGLGSHALRNTLERIKQAYGTRLFIADIDSNYLHKNAEKDRSVFQELASLKDSNGGYSNWVNFIKENPNIIPCLQLEDLNQLSKQINFFASLKCTIAVRFTKLMLPSLNQVLAQISIALKDKIFIVIDYEQRNYDHSKDPEIPTRLEETDATIKQIINILPNATIAISSTSFPSSFNNIDSQEIYERTLFNKIKQQNPGVMFIYSDRGSARAEELGGYGFPRPRIDYPVGDKWHSFRGKNIDDRAEGYRQAAKAVIKSNVWNQELNIWGTEMIKWVDKGNKSTITSPVRSTAVRINIHLHHQLHYGSPRTLLDTDDDWTDN